MHRLSRPASEIVRGCKGRERRFFMVPAHSVLTRSAAESHPAKPPYAEPPSEESPSAESPSAESSSAESTLVHHTTPLSLQRAAPTSPNHTTSTSSCSSTSPYPDSAEPQPQLSSPGYSPFDHLPIDLFQLIVSSLPPLAAASLSLTCKSILFLLRAKYLNQYRRRGCRKRLGFLHLLARGLPTHIVCIECEKLHSRTQKQINEATPCKKADYKSNLSLHIHPDFDSITFLLALKRHHNNLNPRAQLTRLSASRTISKADHTHHWESTARIVNGNLLLRHKSWYNFPAGAKGMSITNLDTCACPDLYNVPYADTSSGGPEYLGGYPVVSALSRVTRLTLKLACRASHWDDAGRSASCVTCAGLFQCMFCPTEFQIEAKIFAEQGVALILTRWLDLGDGSLGHERYASRLRGYKGKPVRFEAGSIKAAFEGGGLDTEKMLTTKYETGMVRHGAV
ncbi:hypothetical protein VE00_03911 [Pseudogymnoascus sp. WSF 3629]|nr:hypothetical protein VE00_03911 [Pseudogymnoascus sp. WSF 3629]